MDNSNQLVLAFMTMIQSLKWWVVVTMPTWKDTRLQYSTPHPQIKTGDTAAGAELQRATGSFVKPKSGQLR